MRVSISVSAPRYSTAATVAGTPSAREPRGLGPDADRERVAARVRPARRRADAPAASAAGITFIGGVPTKRAAKIVAGFSYSAAGAASCSMRPLRISTTWSAMVIASTWSCVTYSMVMPRRRCSARISRRISTRNWASRLESGSSIRQTARLGHDGAAERDALLLAAGELRGLALEQRLEPENAGGALRAAHRARRAARRAPSGRTGCSRRPTDAETARSSGTPSRRRAWPAAAR